MQITTAGQYYWLANDRSTASGWQGLLVEWRPPSQPRELIRAGRAGALLQQLWVSDAWLAWIEHRDQVRGADSRVYVMPLGGSQPILIDDIAQHGPVATFPEMTLDGADLYWIPAIVDGVWKGSLLHKRLPSGPRRGDRDRGAAVVHMAHRSRRVRRL